MTLEFKVNGRASIERVFHELVSPPSFFDGEVGLSDKVLFLE